MNKLVRNHKIKHALQLIMFVGFAIIFIVFREQFLEAFTHNDMVRPLWFTIIFLGCISVVVITIIFMSIKEVFRSEEKIKADKKQQLQNRIRSIKERGISYLEKEMDKWE